MFKGYFVLLVLLSLFVIVVELFLGSSQMDTGGKVNDKPTQSQAVQGADTMRRAMKKRTRTRARGQGLDNWGRLRGGAQGVE